MTFSNVTSFHHWMAKSSLNLLWLFLPRGKCGIISQVLIVSFKYIGWHGNGMLVLWMLSLHWNNWNHMNQRGQSSSNLAPNSGQICTSRDDHFCPSSSDISYSQVLSKSLVFFIDKVSILTGYFHLIHFESLSIFINLKMILF